MIRIQTFRRMGLLIGALILSPLETWAAGGLSPVERLGKALFHDRDLSSPSGQSCGDCHGRQAGFSGPVSRINKTTAIYPGAVTDRFGNRKPPTAAYGGNVLPLTFDEVEGAWYGGLFWDGRATGARLGDPLAEQALGPFLNPLEQNNADAASVCAIAAASDYSSLFESVWGTGSLDCIDNVDETYDRIGLSIAAYERSSEVSPYSSKFDSFLNGETALTAEEASGFDLFVGRAGCASCHTAKSDPDIGHPTFSTFGYANLGLPRNENNPFYTMGTKWNPDGEDWVDPGLGATLRNLGYNQNVFEVEWGKHRIPTLRNVERRPGSGFSKAFGHNGYFNSTAAFIHYCNTRDILGAGWSGVPWPPAEVEANMTDRIGDLGLSSEEERFLNAFLMTLSDGFSV